MTIGDPSLVKAPSVDFYPIPGPSTLIGHPRREQTPDGKVAFVIPIESADPSIQSLFGLLVVGDQGFLLAKPPTAGPEAGNHSSDRGTINCDASGSGATAAPSPRRPRRLDF